jgi:hypothetical protein
MIGDKPSHGASRIEVGINARRATLRRISDLKMIGDVPSHGASRICLLPSPSPRSAAPAFLARLSFCNLRRALRGLSQIACSYLLFWRSDLIRSITFLKKIIGGSCVCSNVISLLLPNKNIRNTWQGLWGSKLCFTRFQGSFLFTWLINHQQSCGILWSLQNVVNILV